MSRITSIFAIGLLTLAIPVHGQHSDHQHHHSQPAATPKSSVAIKPRLVKFPTRLREETLSNMRDHLLALAEIQDQLANGQFDQAAEIAEKRLGMSSLHDHGAHEVAKYMPKGMQEAGGAMHRAASRFALTAQEAAIDRDTGKALGALATLTQACVACHAGYRLR